MTQSGHCTPIKIAIAYNKPAICLFIDNPGALRGLFLWAARHRGYYLWARNASGREARTERNLRRSLTELRECHENKGGMAMKNRLQEMVLGSCLALGLAWSSQARAEDLRIGFISPITGIFAQIGKDMVDGFQ